MDATVENLRSSAIRASHAAVLAFIVSAGGCRKTATYNIGDCVVPEGAQSPEKIVRIVAVEGKMYRTFSHFLSDGKLILGEDYGQKPRDDLERAYVKIECPRTEGAFSPDRFLDKK